jgi:hypothetical protein
MVAEFGADRGDPARCHHSGSSAGSRPDQAARAHETPARADAQADVAAQADRPTAAANVEAQADQSTGATDVATGDHCADRDARTRKHRDGRADRDTHGYGDPYRDLHKHRDSYGDRDAHTYSDQVAHAYGNRYRERYPHCYRVAGGGYGRQRAGEFCHHTHVLPPVGGD